MNIVDMMKSVEDQAFGRLNREQEKEEKAEVLRDLMEDEVSMKMNAILDVIVSGHDITVKEAIDVVEKVLREIKGFHGVGK